MGASNSLVFETESLHGVNGFTIHGSDSKAYTGSSIDTIGDVNDDGYDDFVIGAYGMSSNGLTENGVVYVVFGSANFTTNLSNGVLDLASDIDGTNGFSIDGLSDEDYLGSSVSRAGDFNGDGIGDFVIGAWNADPSGIVHYFVECIFVMFYILHNKHI